MLRYGLCYLVFCSGFIYGIHRTKSRTIMYFLLEKIAVARVPHTPQKKCIGTASTTSSSFTETFGSFNSLIIQPSTTVYVSANNL